MANVTTSTAAAFIPDLWADAIKAYAERAFRIKPLVRDYSSLVAGSGDSIKIPKVSEETAAAKSADTAVTYSAQTDGSTTISLNQHFYEAKRIEDIASAQSQADLFSAYAESMGYALSKKVENYLAVDVIQSATGNDVSLSADNTITAAELRSGLVKLWDAGVDTTSGNVYMMASPEAYKSLLGLEEFSSALRRGDGQNPVVSGALGMVYGIPVFVSTDWDDDGGTGNETASLFTRESIAFASQIEPRVQAAYDIDHLANSVVADTLFGASLVHDNQVVNFNNP